MEFGAALGILLSAIVFVTMMSLLVAAHELGHFLAAKMCGMDVEEFAIGFGKWKWVYMRRNGTEYTFRPFPLGGFVRIKGMMPFEDGSETKIPRGFYSKSPLSRIVVLFAGPLFSVLFGIVVLAGVYMSWGKMMPVREPVIGLINPGGPADKAGLKLGDRILTIAGQPVDDYYDIVLAVRGHEGGPLEVSYRRDGKVNTAQVTPILDEQPTPVIGPNLEFTTARAKQYKIGARWSSEPTRLSPGIAMREAWLEPWRVGAQLIAVFSRPATIKNEVGGPATIAVVTHAATQSGLSQVIWLAAMLSITLGFMNLFPIPPFDGGQMSVAFVELLRGGRRLSFQLQSAINAFGFFLMIAILLGVLFVDFNRFAR